MEAQINEFLARAVGLAWGPVLIYGTLLVGLFLTFRLGFVQIRGFLHAIRVIMGRYDRPDETGHISHFQALSAAVSGTVGLGNIAGVAIAINMGGPGAVFWMWVVALLGMAVKYTECGLATVFRRKDEYGTVQGGAMYYMLDGLGKTGKFGGEALWKPLAYFFAFCTSVACLGGGNMFQSNQSAQVLRDYYGVDPRISGIVLTILVGLVIIGGIKSIGTVAAKVVPFMCVGYVLGALYICLANLGELPAVLGLILRDAFTGQAVAGGAVYHVIMWGVKRAVFSSESGLGSAPFAHAAARTDVPMRQGIVALLEPFIDTIVVCSATASVIVLSGLYGDPANADGVTLSANAFEHFIPHFGSKFVAFAAALFAFSTAISWSYYGEVAVSFLFGHWIIRPFKLLFVICLYIGAVTKLEIVLNFSDTMMALMAYPNLLALVALSGTAAKLTKDYFDRMEEFERKAEEYHARKRELAASGGG